MSSDKRREPEGVLQTYLSDINTVPLLNAQEEHELALRVKAGDPEARERMIRSNLRLVVSIAKKYLNRGLSFMDLIEEGNLGLLKAVERFDPHAKTRFSTYSTWWIKQSIRRALVNTVRTVRIPSYMVELIAKWKSVSIELSYSLGRPPSFSEVAAELDISPDSIGFIKKAFRSSGASTSSGADSLWALNDSLVDEKAKRPDEHLFDSYDVARIEELLDVIDQREAHVLRMRYGLGDQEPKTLKEIGDRIKLTRERVRQIESEAIRKLQIRLNQE